MSLILTGASVIVAFAAVIIERLVGYPHGLFRFVRHPAVWMGAFVSLLDQLLNQPGWVPRLRGAVALVLLLAAVLAVTVPVTFFIRGLPGGVVLEALLAASLLSQKDLGARVSAVADSLGRSLEDARMAVAHIVGRDPEILDEAGIARAAVESLAENASDGVIAPLFWLLVAGLPGMALYKAINTADSMIGYRTDRYRDFGWAAARLDDLANWLPARLTGALIVLAAGLAGGDTGRAGEAMRRDAPGHISPNAGWPEAAMAGALGVRLGGPRRYAGAQEELAWMGEGRTSLGVTDIRAALRIYRRMLDIVAILLAAAAAAFIRF